jgi:hypothetical protein
LSPPNLLVEEYPGDIHGPAYYEFCIAKTPPRVDGPETEITDRPGLIDAIGTWCGQPMLGPALPRSAYIHVPSAAITAAIATSRSWPARRSIARIWRPGKELSWLKSRTRWTRFFGGGTPTHLPPQGAGQLFELAKRWFTRPRL